MMISGDVDSRCVAAPFVNVSSKSLAESVRGVGEFGLDGHEQGLGWCLR